MDDSHSHESDGALIAAVNAGDAGAFERLYFRYRDWVVQLAFRFTGDREIALDVLQETFLYVLRKFPGFQLTAQFKTFLYPVVRNLSIAARRKRDRLQSDEALLESLPAAEPASGPDDVRQALAEVLNALSPEHREVLLLRFADDLPLQEIAIALGIPTGTVKSRLHHALGSLRRDPRTRNLLEG